ncbi:MULTISPECIES: DUF2922 domain-containing protein [Bacillales]|uniref:DUF2922 domain-containing protein n=1 Tax=Bacillales TaxID=1385 RepID=UPI00096F172F|nr:MULTISPECIES: DUF2922 domain-containing protein [Bacillales]MBG9588031.1 hypothetical protein [Cytobacillus firmus]MBY6053619.1 DUF2922 domain-containing protein [Cytobacillus firmus]OMF55144.1 hypothetical protein BK139_17615 [Paenibacillus sp. FSL R5-0490]
MAKSLEMTFETEMGKQTKLSVDSPKEPIDPAAVKAVMEQIIAANAFDGNGGDLVAAKGARLVERNVTDYELM